RTEGNTGSRIGVAPAEERGVLERGAVRADFRDERVEKAAAVMGLERRDERKIRRVRHTGQIHRSVRIERNRVALVGSRATEVGRINQPRSARIDLREK